MGFGGWGGIAISILLLNIFFMINYYCLSYCLTSEKQVKKSNKQYKNMTFTER